MDGLLNGGCVDIAGAKILKCCRATTKIEMVKTNYEQVMNPFLLGVTMVAQAMRKTLRRWRDGS